MLNDEIIPIKRIVSYGNENEIENIILSSGRLPFNFNPLTSGDGLRTDLTKNHCQWVCDDFDESAISKILYNAEDSFNFKIKQMFRQKINVTTPQPDYPENFYSMPHHDYMWEKMDEKTFEKTYSLIYYVNDSDGDTYFFNHDLTIKTQTSPKKGTAVLFPSKIWHSPSPPRNHSVRASINFVFEIE